MQENDLSMIEIKDGICINVYCYENDLTFPIYISDQKFEDSIGLLQIFYGDKSRYVYIKDFERFMYQKKKNENKKYFCKCCLQCFSSSKHVLTKH